MQRDMSKAQFDKECKRYGFKPTGFLGYYSLPNTPTHVSVLNAGPRRRSRLAYLIREHEKALERHGREKETAADHRCGSHYSVGGDVGEEER